MVNFIHIKRLVLAAILLFLGGLSANCQDTANPFELQPRLEASAVEDSIAVIPISTNPFDIVTIAASGQPARGPGFQIRTEKTAKPLTAKEIESIRKWIDQGAPETVILPETCEQQGDTK